MLSPSRVEPWGSSDGTLDGLHREDHMSRSRRLRLSLIVAVASTAACAPVVFAPGTGFGVAVGPSLSPSLSACSLLGSSSLAARLGLSTPSLHIGELRNRVAAIQSKYALSANAPGSEKAAWKRAATGECY
jgi:hypothetical protein